ncbi:MAG: hypothetical protein AABY22_27490, partial [Nanoarchaeota archaeon]
MRINEFGYIERRTGRRGQSILRDTSTWRDWWLVKNNSSYTGFIPFSNIGTPRELIGKKVRIKIEKLDTSYEDIKKDFELRLERLQEECRHKKTKWMDEWWAMGHSTGKKVKVCL